MIFRLGGIQFDWAHPQLEEGVARHGVLPNQQMKAASVIRRTYSIEPRISIRASDHSCADAVANCRASPKTGCKLPDAARTHPPRVTTLSGSRSIFVPYACPSPRKEDKPPQERGARLDAAAKIPT
jgi:hypothetical protein